MAGAEAQPPGAGGGGRKTDKRGRPVLDPAEVRLLLLVMCMLLVEL